LESPFFPFCSELTSRIHESLVISPDPPVEQWVDATRCSTARVRFAAPKTGAPLPAARRCGDLESTTGGSGGITRLGGLRRPVGRPAQEMEQITHTILQNLTNTTPNFPYPYLLGIPSATQVLAVELQGRAAVTRTNTASKGGLLIGNLSTYWTLKHAC